MQIEAGPAAHQGRTQASPPAVTLTRHPDGAVRLRLNNHDCLVAGTDTQAADVLGIDQFSSVGVHTGDIGLSTGARLG